MDPNMPEGVERGIAEKMVDVCRRLYDRGYVVGTSGNVSVLLEANRFLVTPRDLRKGDVGVADLVVCDTASGKRVAGILRPTSELAVHHKILMERQDVRAIIHAHPHYCIACSLCEIPLNEVALPELTEYVGEIAIVPYERSGTKELAERIEPYLVKGNCFILEHHGVIVVGKSLDEAFNRLEQMEFIARIAYLTCSIGIIEPAMRTRLRRFSFLARRTIGLLHGDFVKEKDAAEKE